MFESYLVRSVCIIIIASLKKAGYTNEPTNDMYPVDVLPLSEADAIDLALSLLEGENISTSNLQKTAFRNFRSL
jgi:hypothetical protein